MKLSRYPMQILPPHYAPSDDAYLGQCSLSTLTSLVNAQAARCLEHARQTFPRLPAPAVWCDLRGKSAGQAHFARKGLRFNPVLLQEHPRELLETVVPHEMAHWVVHYAIGTRLKPHGAEWQWIMWHMFGLPPKVTHRLDTRRASPAPYVYVCGCVLESGAQRQHHFSLRRHNMVRRRGQRYVCRHCREELRYLGEQGHT